MLAAMEAAGMIQRTPSSTDQRRQIISLTPKSRALIARIKPQIEARYAHLDERFGTAHLQALCQAVDAAVAVMEADMQDVEGRWRVEPVQDLRQ
jgi:DNA-binding MarR family transcriptional regulator